MRLRFPEHQRFECEGFHRDIGQKGITGNPLGVEGNQLVTAFAPLLRIVRYEEAVDFGDWTRSGLKVPLVRMVARKGARPGDTTK